MYAKKIIFVNDMMIEFNADKLRNPLQAGVVGGVMYMLFLMGRDRLITKQASQKPLSEYAKPSIVVGGICALVMHMSNGPNKRVLSEPFEQPVPYAQA